MYEKNLNSLIHVRLSSDDIEFLYFLSKKRKCSRSDVIRQIIGDYRRQFNHLGGSNSGHSKTHKHY